MIALIGAEPHLHIHLSYEGAKLSLPSQQGFWVDCFGISTSDAEEALRWLTCYAARKSAPLPSWIRCNHTGFDALVQKALLDIPFGQTVSYRDLAEAIGKPKAARAVGRACGRNSMPLLFACHRVIRSDGGYGGFSGGIEIKKRLLAFETALPKSI